MFQAFAQSFIPLPSVWDQFWFSPTSTRVASRFRTALGLVLVLQFLQFFFWVPQWLSGSGWYDLETGRYLIGEGLPDTGSQYRWSLLFWATQPMAGYAISGIGLIAGIAMLAGIGGRLVPLVAWFCMVTVHHRAPLLTLPGEFLLSAGLLYCTIDPGKVRSLFTPGRSDDEERTTSNLSVRCVQIHLLLWLAFSVASMLQYAAWWNGTAAAIMTEQYQGIFGVITRTGGFAPIMTFAILGLQVLAFAFLPRASTSGFGFLCLGLFAFLVAARAGDVFYALALLAFGLVFIPDRIPPAPSTKITS